MPLRLLSHTPRCINHCMAGACCCCNMAICCVSAGDFIALGDIAMQAPSLHFHPRHRSLNIDQPDQAARVDLPVHADHLWLAAHTMGAHTSLTGRRVDCCSRCDSLGPGLAFALVVCSSRQGLLAGHILLFCSKQQASQLIRTPSCASLIFSSFWLCMRLHYAHLILSHIQKVLALAHCPEALA